MTVTLMAQLTLATLFLAAATAKALAGLRRVREGLSRFSIVPRSYRTATTVGLIAAEFAAGILLFTPAYRFGALLATLLALLFGWAVSTAMVRGQRFSCHCFGTWKPLRVGVGLLIVDLVLLSVASFVLLNAHLPGNDAALPQLAAIASITLVAGLALQSLRVRWRPRHATRAASLPVGTAAPRFVVTALGERHWDANVLYRDTTLLLFVAPACKPCSRALRSLRETLRGLPPLEALIIGPPDEVRTRQLAQRYELQLQHVISGESARQLRRLFDIRAVPCAVLIQQGVITATQLPARVADLKPLLREDSPPPRRVYGPSS
jgi:hypothetical protein